MRLLGTFHLLLLLYHAYSPCACLLLSESHEQPLPKKQIHLACLTSLPLCPVLQGAIGHGTTSVEDNIVNLKSFYQKSVFPAVLDKVEICSSDEGPAYNGVGNQVGRRGLFFVCCVISDLKMAVWVISQGKAATQISMLICYLNCSQPTQANYFYQALVLSQRMFTNNWRNPGVFWIRLMMYAVLCICIGTIFFDLNRTWKVRPCGCCEFMFSLLCNF